MFPTMTQADIDRLRVVAGTSEVTARGRIALDGTRAFSANGSTTGTTTRPYTDSRCTHLNKSGYTDSWSGSGTVCTSVWFMKWVFSSAS
jgi:hypothetical protein